MCMNLTLLIGFKAAYQLLSIDSLSLSMYERGYDA